MYMYMYMYIDAAGFSGARKVFFARPPVKIPPWRGGKGPCGSATPGSSSSGG